MNTGEILKAAAGRVRQGWTRRIREDNSGNVCALGAISLIANYGNAWDCTDDHQRTPYVMAYLQLAAQLPRGVFDSRMGDVTQWNNADDQTAENVAAGLEYAALVWEQEQAVNAGATTLATGATASAQSLSSSSVGATESA